MSSYNFEVLASGEQIKNGDVGKMWPHCGTGRQAKTESTLSGLGRRQVRRWTSNTGVSKTKASREEEYYHCFSCLAQPPLCTADGNYRNPQLDNVQSETLEHSVLSRCLHQTLPLRVQGAMQKVKEPGVKGNSKETVFPTTGLTPM